MFELKIIVDELMIIQRIICKNYENKNINILKKKIINKFPDIIVLLCDNDFMLISDFFNIFQNHN